MSPVHYQLIYCSLALCHQYYIIYAHDFWWFVIPWSCDDPWLVWVVMMTSNGNIFRFTGPLWGEPLVTGGFSLQGPVTISLICAWTNSWANSQDAGDFKRHRTDYDVIVMTGVIVGLFLCHWGNYDSHATTTPQLRNEANIVCIFLSRELTTLLCM